MALEHCLQMRTTSDIRVVVPKCYHPVALKEKLNLPTSRGFKKPLLTFSSGKTLHGRRTQKSRLICQAKEAVDEVKVVTDSSWNELVISSRSPVMVEFWAPWCGPCRMITPVINELAKEYAGKIACYKINTDDCPSIATEYGIRSIPTVLFFKNGEKKESVIGAVPKSTLSATIEKYLDM